MRRILLPVNIVVVHAADHQCVGQRGGDGIDALARANHRRRTAPGDLVEHFQRDLHIVLLVSAQRAAHGIEQEPLGLVNGVLRKLLVVERRSPARHFGGDGFFGGVCELDTKSPISAAVEDIILTFLSQLEVLQRSI